MNTGMMPWQRILLIADIVVAAIVVLMELLVVRKGYAKRKTNVK